MSKKVVAILVEGETELYFYKKIVKNNSLKLGDIHSIQYCNLRGVGQFKKDALRKYQIIKKEYTNYPIDVFICIDSDAFEFSKNPPFNKEQLKRQLMQAGAHSVKYIVAKKSIEDWFLKDFDGIKSYLRLPKKAKIPNEKTGQKALQKIFRDNGKIYVKGGSSNDFIDKLDLNKIMSSCCKDLSPLCKATYLNCGRKCDFGKRKNK